MNAASDSRFEYRGEFAGFVRTLEGKRRMRLRVDGAELLLKVPKPLREQLFRLLVPGQTVVATGVEQRDRFTEKMKRVVSGVRALTGAESDEAACVACPIRVCAKKNCWRSGGKELWHALEHELGAAGLETSVQLKAVTCLDNCKRAPNATWGRHFYQRATPSQAGGIVAQIAAELGLPGHAKSVSRP